MNVQQVLGGALGRGAVCALLPIVTAPAWSQNYQIDDLGTLGGNSSRAVAINSAGDVAGGASTASGAMHAFLWQNGVIRDLGTLGGSSSYARSITNTGRVVGEAMNAKGEFHATLWGPGYTRDLQVDNRLFGEHSVARDINDFGVIAGVLLNENNAPYPYATLWTPEGVRANLEIDEIFAVNAAGHVLGLRILSDIRVLLWRGNEIVEIQTDLPAGEIVMGGAWYRSRDRPELRGPGRLQHRFRGVAVDGRTCRQVGPVHGTGSQ